MIASRPLAGLIAGLPLAALLIVYILARGRAMGDVMKSTSPEFARLSDAQMTLVLLAMFAGMALFLGLVSGVVYGLVRTPELFRAVALGLAVLMTAAAVLTRTPMMVDKIVANFAVAIVLGGLVPVLAA